MDEKLSEQAKPKLTRSRARHERRKRLLTARKAAEKNPLTETINPNIDVSNDSKSPTNRNVTALTKSKARRLRKRNKTNESRDKSTEINNSSPENPEYVDQTQKDSFNLPENPKIETKQSRNLIIELSSTKKSDSPKLSATENELLENEKNLKITESSKPIKKSSPKTIETKKASQELIINKESPKTIETSDEFSLTKENSPNIPSIAGKMISQEKTREQIKAEREAKKAAKAAAKGKPKLAKTEIPEKTVDPPSNTKKLLKEHKIDVEIVVKTNKLTITDSKKKPDIVSSVESRSEGGKSKSELRAERRAKQEAQRAAKQVQVTEKTKPKITLVPSKATPISPGKLEDSTKKVAKRGAVPKENAHEINLFKHLYHEREQSLINVPTVNSRIHPAIVRLGVQYANKVIVGSNARCVALLSAVKQLIEDFERPSQADFTRGLEASLQESSAYLHHCRPLAVSMQNALRHLKWQMTQLPSTTSDEEAKTKLGNAIETYIQEQIQLADKAISLTIQTKIYDGDVILTYGYSSLIHKILCDAHDANKKFRVVVVDGRPWLEGRELLRRLAKHGLECSYVLINALSFIMPEVSKVFLGAHAILANGAVMSRVGTAQVALMAKAFNVPVLVACETHKTCERVQTDSIVYNEIADADELAQNLMGSSKRTTLMNWRAKKSLNLLNLTYDVTPADLVTAVVTELAILPCTSVPVILRIKPSEI